MKEIQQYEEGWQSHRVRPVTPLRAKRLLKALGTSQSELRYTLRMQDGSTPSAFTVGQIMNRNIWPAQTPKNWLKQQIEKFLSLKGAKEEDIKNACDIDDGLYQPCFTYQRSTRPTQAESPMTNLADQLPETVMLTQVAKKHFKLFKDPFKDDVQGREDVFLSDSHRHIREAMFFTAKHGGFMAVVGESGAGKTVLRRDLLDRIQREGHQITCIMPRIIDKFRLTSGAICDAVIEDMSIERPRRSLEAKARQIEKLLAGSARAGNKHVLIIEEAHDLSIHTLKYLKRFWELEDGFQKLLSIILIGQLELKAKLDERQNWEAREVIRRVELAELEALNDDLEGYLELKFKRIDKSLNSIFEQSAFDAIRKRLTFKDSKGNKLYMQYPLVVNNLVVKCMNLSAEIGADKINSEIVGGV